MNEAKTKKMLRDYSSSFITTWGNTKNQLDWKYYDSVSKYLNNDQKTLLKDDLQSLSRFNVPGTTPNEYKTDIKEITISKKDSSYIATAKIRYKIVDYKTEDKIMTIIWDKYKDSYLITNFYTDK
jgi:hypothetical protein